MSLLFILSRQLLPSVLLSLLILSSRFLHSAHFIPYMSLLSSVSLFLSFSAVRLFYLPFFSIPLIPFSLIPFILLTPSFSLHFSSLHSSYFLLFFSLLFPFFSFPALPLFMPFSSLCSSVSPVFSRTIFSAVRKFCLYLLLIFTL